MATSSDASDSSPIIRPQRNIETVIIKPRDDVLHGKRAVLFALGANLFIGSMKLLVGMAGRQSAVLSEAMHSFADAINSGFLLIGLQKGSRMADKTHPYGYGLETTLWAMIASLLMLALAFWSIYLGINRILHPEHLANYEISAFVLIASVFLEMSAVNVAANTVLNEKNIIERGWLKKIILAGQHVKTVISPTTRFVYYEDTIALIGAIVALIAITVSEFGTKFGILPAEYGHIPDASASVLIGCMLLGLSFYLFLHNSKGLTGSAASPQVEQRIRDFVLNLNGVSQIHDLRTIDYGMSGVVVHMRVEVDPDTQVKDVDDLTDRIRDRVQARVGNVKEVIIEVLADETGIEWSDEFYQLIEQGQARKVLKPREARILRNVYDFTKIVVQDIMIPRTDVDCIEASEPLNDLINMIIETGHTRIPVYEEDIDNMIGAIHAKDIFDYIRQDKTDVPLRHLVREFDIYPENKPVSDLFEEFKRKKIQIAMVADEHGGFAGIVTLEDLLEEIVGEIWDEYDTDTALLEHVEPNRMVVAGRYDIDELNERYNLGIPDESFKTIGGFVFGLLGREPQQGDLITFEDLTFTVIEMDGHRVEKVEIQAPSPFIANLNEEDAEYQATSGNGNNNTESNHPNLS